MAGRPALPKNIHILKGTGKKHPDRMKARENEPENKSPVKPAPDYFSPVLVKLYNEIVGISIDGVLGEADSIAVEQAAILLSKLRGLHIEDGEVVKATIPEHNQFFKYLSQFGMLPSDRSKIQIAPKKKVNRFDD